MFGTRPASLVYAPSLAGAVSSLCHCTILLWLDFLKMSVIRLLQLVHLELVIFHIPNHPDIRQTRPASVSPYRSRSRLHSLHSPPRPRPSRASHSFTHRSDPPRGLLICTVKLHVRIPCSGTRSMSSGELASIHPSWCAGYSPSMPSAPLSFSFSSRSQYRRDALCHHTSQSTRIIARLNPTLDVVTPRYHRVYSISDTLPPTTPPACSICPMVRPRRPESVVYGKAERRRNDIFVLLRPWVCHLAGCLLRFVLSVLGFFWFASNLSLRCRAPGLSVSSDFFCAVGVVFQRQNSSVDARDLHPKPLNPFLHRFPLPLEHLCCGNYEPVAAQKFLDVVQHLLLPSDLRRQLLSCVIAFRSRPRP